MSVLVDFFGMVLDFLTNLAGDRKGGLQTWLYILFLFCLVQFLFETRALEEAYERFRLRKCR